MGVFPMASNKLTVEEASIKAHLSKTVIIDYINRGVLKATNVGNGDKRARWIIEVTDLDDFIERKESRENSKEPIPMPKVDPIEYRPVTQQYLPLSAEKPAIVNIIEKTKATTEMAETADEKKDDLPDIQAIKDLLDEAVNYRKTKEQMAAMKSKLRKLAEAAMDLAAMAEDLANET